MKRLYGIFLFVGAALLRHFILDQARDFLPRPNMIGNPRFHRRSDTQGYVNAPEVVIREVKRYGVFKVLDLLAESVGNQAGIRISLDCCLCGK